jgi:hypothetical protein
MLADDLSDIADITHIDLSGIRSLEGTCVVFACLMSLAIFVESSYRKIGTDPSLSVR